MFLKDMLENDKKKKTFIDSE